MANTTNFGWETPDDTDLVKDGAAAMRTLGNAIDTSFVDLKGGTTGQVLSKASNTDLDFTWVAQDDSNAIQNAIVDAKGDLISATAADTPARLAVGANETRLVADSAATTGLKYVADTTNYAINAKGDLLAGTAADTLTPLTVGGNFAFLSADSSTATGLLWDISAFTSYTPTLTPGSGAFTSATVAGKYKRIGKVCVVKIVVTITTAGTAAGTINVTLPFTSVNDGDAYAAGTFRENAATGVMGVGRVLSNSSSCVIAKYDDTSFIASSRTIVGTIIYEVA